MAESGLVARNTLTVGEAEDVLALEDACLAADGIRVRFAWDVITNRAGERPSDFCWVEGSRIVGYASLDDADGPCSVTVAVLPDYRRRGIFRTLFEAARAEALRRRASSLTLVSFRGSAAGTAAALSVGGRLRSTPLRLGVEAESLPPRAEAGLEVRRANAADADLLARLEAATAPAGEPTIDAPAIQRYLRRPGAAYYIGFAGGEPVGDCWTNFHYTGTYIGWVGVLPEHRRRGYGRQLLLGSLWDLVEERYHRRFELDVAPDNTAALALYRACGFSERVAFELYEMPMRPAAAG